MTARQIHQRIKIGGEYIDLSARVDEQSEASTAIDAFVLGYRVKVRMRHDAYDTVLGRLQATNHACGIPSSIREPLRDLLGSRRAGASHRPARARSQGDDDALDDVRLRQPFDARQPDDESWSFDDPDTDAAYRC